MISPSQLLHRFIGSPVRPECFDLSGCCWVCGCASTRMVARQDFMGANFVGQNKVRAPSSDHVCESCVVVMSGRPPDTLRMYSHLFDAGRDEYHRLNKGDKPQIRAWLRGWHVGPWFAAIADSGQKHVIPWTPVNPPGASTGTVLFEETLIKLPGPDGWELVDALASLLTDGATKEETARGEYGAGAWGRCATAIAAFEAQWGGNRGSGWFDLALWLAQRDEATVQARMAGEKTEREEKKRNAKVDRGPKRVASGGNGRRRDGGAENGADARRVTAKTVGPIDVAPASGGAVVGASGIMGVEVHPRPADQRPVQGSLFGDSSPGGHGGSRRKRVA